MQNTDFPNVENVAFALVKGFPNYCVGTDGSLWSKSPGRWGCRAYWRQLKVSGRSGKGYRLAVMYSGGATKSVRMARLVLEVFVGKCPEGMEACHKDGNKTNDSLGNLRWGTSQENQLDKRAHGTMLRGDRHHKAKLTEEQVRYIRSATHKAVTELAAQFGVSKQTICGIRSRSSWRHVL